jgi:hypothetical protein
LADEVVWSAEAIGGTEDDRRVGECGILTAGLGDDALEQSGGRLGAGILQHLHPGGSALGVGEHGGAGGATGEVEVEGDLVRGRESSVECVGEHRLTLGAVLRVAGTSRSTGSFAAELIEVCHLDHLSL